ncbi:MAG: cytochrome c [Phycisphaeraceae bacterium]
MSTYQDERVPFPSPGRLRRELRLRRPPLWMVVALFVVVSLTWPPLALIMRARVSFKDQPRIAPIQDMAKQPSYGPQAPAEVFADGRAMRLPPPGSVARGTDPADSHFTQGLVARRDERGATVPQFATSLPASVPVDDRLLQRGRVMYGVYCAPCHGQGGFGDGPVNQRALELKEPAWVAARSLHEPAVVEQPDGYLFGVITHGVRTMPPHDALVKPADRWSIVAYVRALQRSQRATLDDVPAEMRATLEHPTENAP